MDFETLYRMAAGAARNAERMCSQDGGSATGLPFQNYAGYPFYVDEYNRLLILAAEADPAVTKYFQGIDLGNSRSPLDTPGPMWKSYAELAAVRLNSLASYLQAKLGTTQQEHGICQPERGTVAGVLLSGGFLLFGVVIGWVDP
jgi:hypothetical protein